MEGGGRPVVHIPGEGEYPYPPLAHGPPYQPEAHASPYPPGGDATAYLPERDVSGDGPDLWPELPEAPAKPRRRRRTGRIIALVAGSLIVLVVLTVAGLWLYADHALHRVDAIDDYPDRPAGGAGTNWLIVGSDSRQGLSSTQVNQLHTGTEQAAGGSRTDTIMVLHLPGNGTKPTMVSLLRDSYVTIPGHDKDKINAAFTLGGPQLLVRTVEENTGLRIDHYAEIGLGGFANVVGDVGGVRMCLDQAVHDDYAGIDLRAGCQTLNGPNALGYVRSRHAFATSDYARTEHQRQFIGALAGKIMSPGVLLNPFRSIPAILDLPNALTIDHGDGLWDLITLVRHVRHFSKITSTSVPIGGSSGSDLLWDPTKAQELFHDLNHDQTIPADLITTP
jgi:LCP family protein required for cell wall assembly